MEVGHTAGVEFTCVTDVYEAGFVFITPDGVACITDCFVIPPHWDQLCAFLAGVSCKCYHAGSEVDCSEHRTSTTFISMTVVPEYIGTWKCRSQKQSIVAPAITLQALGNQLFIHECKLIYFIII